MVSAKQQMVMRSLYLTEAQDSELRNIAFETGTSKSDIVRQATAKFLDSLRQLNSTDARRRAISEQPDD